MPRKIHIQNLQRPLDRPIEAVYCDSFLCRMLGLMMRRIEPDQGLLLVHGRDTRIDSSIHMLFCITDLAVVWINSKLDVVDVKLAKKWAVAYVPRKPACYTLEIHPDRLHEFKIGDKVKIIDA